VCQSRFEEVEVKPQAIEYIFSQAAGIPFYVSMDNLMNPQANTDVFQARVNAQVHEYKTNGLPHRAKLFHQSLVSFYYLFRHRWCFV
jgi:elongation factor P hydroxylase